MLGSGVAENERFRYWYVDRWNSHSIRCL